MSDVASRDARRAWYRSLYWRIGLGFMACVAGLLMAQALLFVWLANPAATSLTGRTPQRLASLVASDISAALEADPSLDVDKYVEEQFGHLSRPVVVVMRDGRVIRTRGYDPPPPLLSAARGWLARVGDPDERAEARSRPGADDGGRGESQEERGDAGTRDAGGFRERWRSGPPRGLRERGRSLFGPVTLRGDIVGVVLAPLDGPPWLASLREHGPTLVSIGLVLLIAGTAGMAFFIFRPAQRRLQELQRAASALGAGDTAVRASEQGGDEVASLAHAFNRMAADLEARVRELRESDRARRQLLADVSHELMTPLTAMRGYLETLAMPHAVRDAGARERYLQIVMDETLRLESIIGDLLELARLEGGGVTLQREAVPVAWLFARAADRHGATLREKGITLDTRVAPGAEAVDADPRRLEQALQNLVANAVRHSPEGGRIELSAEPLPSSPASASPAASRESTPGASPAAPSALPSVGRGASASAVPQVRLIVRDSGPGVPPEHLPLIFDRFYKVDASREHQASGSGLGLSIVKAIVERHGGTIAASSPPDGGARFEIVLDAAAPDV